MSDVRPVPPEAALLQDALGLPADAVHCFSREPLGAGSVAGFTVREGDAESIAYVDTSLLDVAAETGLALPGVARIWTHPADPHLPVLAATAFGGAADVLLRRLDAQLRGTPEIVAYRPGRRAVLRADTDRGVRWIKVLPPRRTARIVEAHRALGESGLPVPALLAWSPDGLLVLSGADGMPATDACWDPADLVAEADDLRMRLARAALAQPARAGILSRVEWYCDRLVHVAPARTAAVEGMLARIDAGGDMPAVIHGDLHLGQLFLAADGRITGLIDVDTAGVGDPAEDPAALLAHAVASSVLTPGTVGATRMTELARAAFERWGSTPGVAARTVAQLLGHAVGAFDTGDDARGETLLASAERVSHGRAPLDS